jgi:hypothetical protein
MYFIVVWMSAWPIQAWTRTMVAWLMAIEPNVWRQVMKAQGAELGLGDCLLVAAAQGRVVEELGALTGQYDAPGVWDSVEVHLEQVADLLGGRHGPGESGLGGGESRIPAKAR